MVNRSFRTPLFCAAALVAVFVTLFSGAAFTQERPTASWVQLNPGNSPPARDVSAMAYDPASKKIVLFGGFGDQGYLNDTWTWDGSAWTQVKASVAPSPRTSAMMAYDVGIRKLVLFGGYDGVQFLGDTWIWDGTTSTWTQATPTRSPKAMGGALLFTDPLTGHAGLYGGYDGRFYQLNTWLWMGTTWRKLHLDSAPFARAWGIVAVDLPRRNVLVAGGLGDIRTDNTWTWDGTSWTQQSPQHPIPKIFNTGAAFDPVLHGTVVFGGDEGDGPLNKTQAWTGSDWLQGSPLQSAPAREFEGMAYDFAAHQLLIFGGDDGNVFLNDTWELVPQ